MDGFLFDTSFASSYLSPQSKRHRLVQDWLAQNRDENSPALISSITIGEIRYGADLYLKRFKKPLEHVEDALTQLNNGWQILPVGMDTGKFYGQIKSKIAFRVYGKKFAEKLTKKNLGTVDTWKSDLNQQRLGIDENDLWIAAVALEYNLTLLSTDRDFSIASEVHPALRVIKLGLDAI